MNNNTREAILISEENKAIKFFILLFYFIYIGYDLFYYFILPGFTDKETGLPEGGLGFLVYGLVFLALPPAVYFIRKRNPFPIKYIFLFSYTVIEFINYFLIYFGTELPFRGGHVIELVFIIFSPIFVNKKYFWLVVSTMLLKYITYGLLFEGGNIILAIALIIFISIVAYILLNRFNSYVRSLTKAYEDSKENEKLAVIGQMATAIAHEIKNPLSSLKGFTQLQQEKDKDGEHYYPIMLNEIDRINLIVNDLLILGKPNPAKKSSESLTSVINYVISTIEPHANRKEIKINVSVDDSIVVYCDVNQMKQVFINVIKNAMESMIDGGVITITSITKPNGQIEVSVSDEGCGIEADKVKRLGEPFFTTKQNGTGLGLMVTKKIIEEHDGEFDIKSELGKGTTVTVTFPMTNQGEEMKM